MQRNNITNDMSHHTPSRNIMDHAMEQNLRTRLSIFPNDSHTWFILGCLLRKKGKLEDAERSLRKAVTLNPVPMMFWAELALVLNMLGYGVVDPEILSRLGAELPENTLSENLFEKLDSVQDDDNLNNAEHIESHLTSPCISCPDYTYYGCRKQEACAAITSWRNQTK